MALVDVKGVTKRFGGLTAVSDVDLTVNAGEIHCLIGPNGAGKSTLFKLIVGLYPPTKGTILFDSIDITEERPFARVQRGMSIKMQAPSVFKELPVRQNIQTALQARLSGAERIAEEDRLLTLLNLGPDSDKLAGALSHGQQQWLEIGMALALKPQLLLLDEPTAGMSPEETFKTGELIKSFNAEGMTVLVVEHDMAFVRQVAQRVTVLHLGKIFARGDLESILQDAKVAEIYNGRAIARLQKGDLNGALADYEKAIELKPSLPSSARFNFTYDFGGGVQIVRDSGRAFTFGYKYQHISNGYHAPVNPGIDVQMLSAGFSIFK